MGKKKKDMYIATYLRLERSNDKVLCIKRNAEHCVVIMDGQGRLWGPSPTYDFIGVLVDVL